MEKTAIFTNEVVFMCMNAACLSYNDIEDKTSRNFFIVYNTLHNNLVYYHYNFIENDKWYQFLSYAALPDEDVDQKTYVKYNGKIKYELDLFLCPNSHKDIKNSFEKLKKIIVFK